ncbi:MAG: tRNA (adenosine(37)-N6)-dimethylallyltransferase MiaA [Alphaproteobacteria bacterium]|nr:tRNA (adenosine(37)-N6)-dimethylallyltransferase MiaA [Alphaproteobacteria bacterium]
MKKQKVFIVAGPTASGKSGVALDLAEKFRGEVVNADAFQVYQGLQILTARPDETEMRGIPHHLYGYVDDFSQEDVVGWVQKAAVLIPSLKNPIVVGGTGLYLSVLINGISPIPDVSSEVRNKVRQMDPKEVLAKLTKGKVPRDIQRQKRALEVLLETGHPIDYFQKMPKKKFLDADFQGIILLPDKEKLYARIEKRLNQMLQDGAVEEVAGLIKRKASGGVMKAIGVKELIDFIEKKDDFDTATKKILLSTRHYAKRQSTWFRHQMPENFSIIKDTKLPKVITL